MIGSKPEPTVQPKGWPNEASQPSPASLSPRTADGRTGTGAAIHEPVKPELPVASGARTDAKVPGQDQSYPAQYEVRDLSDVHPFGKELDKALNDALGGKPLKPNVPLRNQLSDEK